MPPAFYHSNSIIPPMHEMVSLSLTSLYCTCEMVERNKSRDNYIVYVIEILIFIVSVGITSECLSNDCTM